MDSENVIVDSFKHITRESNTFTEQCRQLSKKIESNEIKITEVVGDLGVFLVNESVERRSYGTEILSQILSHLPDDILSSGQLHFICTFYSDRLKDKHEVIPSVLQGILAVIKQKNIPDGVSATILASLFHNVSCQQQQKPDRAKIYEIFKTMLERKENELKAMNLDFVYGVISAIAGEKDPANLIILFKWLPHFVKTVNLGHLVEEMFEVIACYFPVDYQVPNQQKGAISRQDLADTLCPCLYAIPEFGDSAISLALEKLHSNLKIAKLDSLELLLRGGTVFNEDVYLDHASEIWQLINKEVLNGNDAEIESLSLKVMSVFIKKIESTNSIVYQDILSNIIDTLKGNLRPDLKLFGPSVKLLLSVSQGSTSSCNSVSQAIVPALINLYNITETIDQKVSILNTLIAFCRINFDLNATKELTLVPHLCIESIVDKNVKLRAAGLTGITVLSGILTPELREIIYKHLKLYLITTLEDNEFTSLVGCLRTLANVYPNEIQDLIKSSQFSNSDKELFNYLNTICCLVGNQDFSEIVLTAVINACLNKYDLSLVGVKVLRKISEKGKSNEFIYTLLDKTNIISSLLHYIINGINKSELNGNISKEYLRDISNIIKEVIGSFEYERQEIVTQEQIDLIISLYRQEHNLIYIYLIDGLLCNLRHKVLKKYDIVEDLINGSLNIEDKDVQQICCQLLGNLINKMDDDNLNKYIQLVENKYENSIANETNVEKASSVVAWTTKALIMRGHELSDVWMQKIIKLLDTYEQAALSFKIIMKEDDIYFSLSSFCNKRLLYRQKFFVIASEILMSNYKDENKNYLLATGYLLEQVPLPLLKMYFEKILRLLVLCLDKCEDHHSLSAILTTLKSLIEVKDEIAESYIGEFIPRLLKLATFKRSMQVRITAVQCIGHYASGFTLYKLLPLKMDVLTALEGCLDDHKRLVRKEAVEARMKWYLMDAPI